MKLGANIRRYREAKGISQEAAARQADVSVVTWGNWERGKIDIPSSRLPEIAAILETTPSALVETMSEQPG